MTLKALKDSNVWAKIEEEEAQVREIYREVCKKTQLYLHL